MNNKILCLADIHFGLNVNNPIFYDINLKLFDWLNEICLKNEIKNIWIAGDIFHNRKEINLLTLNNAYECFDKLKKYNITMITGNHDAWFLDRSEKHSLDLFKNWDNITVYDDITYKTINGKNVGFYPWVGQKYNEIIPDLDVVLGHFEIVGFEYGHSTATHGTSPATFQNVKLTITGHFHKHQDRKLNKSQIYYVGSPYEHDWGDICKKYVHILDLDNLKIEKVRNNISPRHILIKDIVEIDSRVVGNFTKIQLENEDEEIEYRKKLEEFPPLSTDVERIVNATDVKVHVENLKNVEMLPTIEEFISLLNEPEEIRNRLLNENKTIYKEEI